MWRVAVSPVEDYGLLASELFACCCIILLFGEAGWMLTDVQWAVLEPLIEAVRPPAKVPLRPLQRIISAILWRHDNGAK
jgi:hypothetical protein